MKLSISLPEEMAAEVKALATQSERPISWWIQRAWNVARKQLLQTDPVTERQKRQALRKLHRLRGSLKSVYEDQDSVSLSRQAFLK